MDTNRPDADTVVAQTKHLRLVDRHGWSFAQRIGSTGIVCIVAMTADGKVVLVEQYRPPVRTSVIELPAGLAGDVADQPDESLQQAAERELLEETGYVAQSWTRLVTVASSAGLTDEVVTFFRAENLQKKAAGGGDASEDIQVHEVPLRHIEPWLDEAAAAGRIVDARVYAALNFLTRNDR